jgi:hypothetical protein
MRLRFGIWSLLALVGCIDLRADRRVLTDVPFTIGPVALNLHPREPLRAVGPFNELCLGLPLTYGLGMGPNEYKILRPDGKFITIEVTVIDADGRRESFPVSGYALGRGRDICFETRPPRDLHRRYAAVELRADDTLRIIQVRWSAGNRYGSLWPAIYGCMKLGVR